MDEEVIDRLPTVEEVDEALAKNRQDASLLRSIRLLLKRRRLQQNVSHEIRRQLDAVRNSEVPNV